MAYLWDEFNIKTFNAQTIVFRDGNFVHDLSDFDSKNIKITDVGMLISGKSDLPVHIIYVGEITDDNKLSCEITTDDQPVFMTAKISTKKPAVLNIFIKNAGKSSVFDGKFLVDNKSDLKINAAAQHLSENTGILMNFRVIAHPNSYTKLHGVAEILQNCTNCKSDIGFSALAAPDAKIEFFPAQKINAIPDYATHSASIWRNTPAQIEYLKESGLGESAIKEVLEEAYKNW